MSLARLLLALLLSSLAFAQAPDDNKVWTDFVAWMKAQPDLTKLGQDRYKAKLAADGLTAVQVDEWVAVLNKVLPERRKELGPIYFDKLYSTPGQTRFILQPNAYLVAMTKGMKPGKALDVAMGQGRNGVYLATQGWNVTGFDLSEDGMRIARENAAKIGTKITTVKAGFTDFDYGTEQWDLIYFVYTDAPVVDPQYVAKVCASLKKGGLMLLDRPFHPLDRPEPEWGPPIAQDQPNALPQAWSALQLIDYEDTTGIGDWQQTREDREKKQLRIVRMLARKR